MPQNQVVQIKEPNFARGVFHIKGTAPLVIHRFSHKTKNEMLQKMEAGRVAGSKKNREAKDSNASFNASRYVHKDGWDGFNASSIRAAMISACRLVGFKMTLAKMSVFVEPDGWDKEEPQIPLIRIHGKPVRQDDMARVETGQPYVTVRAAYHDWTADIKIRWDADQFNVSDITNLLARVGMQVGIGEGRPDSRHSVGMGWGTFTVENKK